MDGHKFCQASKAKHRTATVTKPYQAWSGNLSVPAHQEVWSLCDYQYAHPHGELQSWLDSGFLHHPRQYRGFVPEWGAVRENKATFPTANFHPVKIENAAGIPLKLWHEPALVYLDYCAYRDSFESMTTVLEGLLVRDEHPLVVVNIMVLQERGGNVNDFRHLWRDDLAHRLTPEWSRVTAPNLGRSKPTYEYVSRIQGRSDWKHTMLTFWLERTRKEVNT